jgi:hypothetical protein
MMQLTGFEPINDREHNARFYPGLGYRRAVLEIFKSPGRALTSTHEIYHCRLLLHINIFTSKQQVTVIPR